MPNSILEYTTIMDLELNNLTLKLSNTLKLLQIKEVHLLIGDTNVTATRLCFTPSDETLDL